jgi:hypothetical protein
MIVGSDNPIALDRGSRIAVTEAAARMNRRDFLWALVFLFAAASLQAVQKVPFDGDTGYHYVIARLIAEHGILHQFPWTPFSILADHYADKELLFHLLLVPVSQLSYPLAAKLVGTLLGTLLLGVFYWILRKEEVQNPGLWTAAMFVSSGAFLMHFVLVRPHVLSIALMMAIAWAAIHEKRRALGLLCFAYPFCYIAWHAVLILLLLVEAARIVSQRTISLPNLGVAVGALALAVLVHPNFPANTKIFWIENVHVLLQKAWGQEPGFALGEELAPMDLLRVLVFLGFPLLVDGMSFVPALRRRADNFPGLAFLVAAIAFVVLTLKSEKFVEYSVPFSFLAGATSLRSMRKPALLALIVVMSAATLLVGSQDLRDLPRRPVLFTSDSTETVRKIIPEGAQVFTCGWEVTGEMMIALPERKFLVALNPVFLWANDADLYHTWFDVVQHPSARAAKIIRSRFHAGFVLCEARAEYLALIQRLNGSPGVREAHRIGPWVLFVLDDPSDRPSSRDRALPPSGRGGTRQEAE